MPRLTNHPGRHDRRRRRARTAAALVGLALAAAGPVAAASAIAPTYSNGFEADTAGWLSFGYSGVDDAWLNTIDGTTGALAQEASGSNATASYAPSVTAASGSGLARVQRGSCTVTGTAGDAASECVAPNTGCYLQSTSGGPGLQCYGPFSRWGGYNGGPFPANGWTTQIDVYLDVDWAAQHPDVRFDFSSAVSDTAKNFLRDFVFNFGTDPAGQRRFVVSASPNATRDSTFPSNPGKDPKYITASGWYTLRHVFRDDGSGNLAVDMTVTPVGQSTPVAGWTLPRPAPDPANEPATPISQVGCNRYGWFVNEEIPGLPVDNASMTGCGTPAVTSATLHVSKYYDANADGTKDGAESDITGWPVSVSDGIAADTLAGVTPFTAATLTPGTWTVAEASPTQTNWYPTTPSSVQKTVAAGDDVSVAFGNVCTGAGGGLSIGFWSSKNAAPLLGSDDLAEMRALNLRNANGSNFDPTKVSELQAWLKNATATNMAYMLSAQTAGLRLSVLNGKVSPTALVWAPGAHSAGPTGFATASDLIAEANTELGLHAVTKDPSPYRGYQTQLKNALEQANLDRSFVQAQPCARTFG